MMKALNSKETVKSFIVTAMFNTLIALVLAIMVIDEPDFFDIFIISQLVGLSICFFVIIAVYFAEQKGNQWSATSIVAGLIAGVFSGSLLSWGFLFFFHGIDFGYFFKDVFSYIFVFGIVFGVPISYFFSSREKIIESEKQIQKEKIKRLTMEKEAAMTTLRLLQAQIEPHFLFNTLSNVISLFEIDIEKAKQMLIDINEYLRISLQRTRQEMITLTQELDLVHKYLEIFKIRMGNRLSYEINDHTDTLDISFPPLIIQPLVENSIKYGIEPKLSGGTIAIDCWVKENTLEIVIADTGIGLDKDANQAGIGINNVSQRLENIYGSAASLILKQNHPTGIKATIRVPL
ncbi:MAG: histidine kinase [Desulfobacula sp.]|nr:histidine kinase [Desulfobacula sp.]